MARCRSKTGTSLDIRRRHRNPQKDNETRQARRGAQGEEEMKRKDFYEQYRQARAMSSAAASFSNDCGNDYQRSLENPVYVAKWFFIDSLHNSVIYAMHNKYKRTPYRIKTNRWAISHNSKF